MTAKRGTSADAEAPCIFSTLYIRDWAPYATVAAPVSKASWAQASASWLSGGCFKRQICPRLQPASANQPLGLRWPAYRPRFRHSTAPCTRRATCTPIMYGLYTSLRLTTAQATRADPAPRPSVPPP